MGMRINGSSAASTSLTSGVATMQQRQQDFKDLFSSLKSGDLASAQKAFANLTAGKALGADSPLSQLGQALQSGDLSAAQQAGQALQAQRSGHLHGHHGAQPVTTGVEAAPAPAPAGQGTIINLIA
jgi:hypothetical protein